MKRVLQALLTISLLAIAVPINAESIPESIEPVSASGARANPQYTVSIPEITFSRAQDTPYSVSITGNLSSADKV